MFVPGSFLLFCNLVFHANSATVFDAFSASLGTLFTEQEEANFKLISKTQDFEEREYGPLKWVCASPVNIKSSSTKKQTETFLQLFDYLEKQNSEGVKIEMSIPVSIRFKKDASTPSAQLSACFYIEGIYQDNPPTPLNANLTISETPSMIVYTRKFGGFVDRPSAWLKEAKELQNVAAKEGKTARTDQMFWNAFDSPVKFWNRRNEVWLVKV